MNKINLNLKTTKAEESLVILRATINGNRFVYSTGIKVPVKHWDPKRQRMHISATLPSARAKNLKLGLLKTQLPSVMQEFYKAGVVPTTQMIKNKLDIKFKKKAIVTNSFTAYIDIFIKEREDDPKFRNASIKVYKTFRNHFRKYTSNKTLSFEDLTVEFILGFIKHLRIKNYADNFVNKLVVTMNTMLNTATERKLNNNMDYKSKLLKTPRRPADGIYLNEHELNKIYRLRLTDKTLSKTRDLFLIGCYTGLRFSDFIRLKRDNIIKLENGRNCIRIITTKTSDLLVIPIHPIVEKILSKYDFILPSSSYNQVMNRHLKVIGELAEINQPVIKRIFRANKAEKSVHKKYELISTHTARRSFASNAYKAGIPSISIMKITGHKREETFMKYIKLSLEEHAIKMAENSFFN